MTAEKSNVIPLFDKATMCDAKHEVLRNHFTDMFKGKKFIVTYLDEDRVARSYASVTSGEGIPIDDLSFMQKMMNKYIDAMYP